LTVAHLADLLLLLVLLSGFLILGTTRLTTCIRAVAAQGGLLGVLPLALHPQGSAHTLGLAAGTILVKAIVLPWFLIWAIREAAVRREVEPRVGYLASLVLGIVAVAVGSALATRLPMPGEHPILLIATSLSCVIMGLLVLATRAKALTQVVGYLMLENGIYIFGLTSMDRVPFLLEIGVLLDVFVAVFIMGIVVFHINREFDSLDSGRLTELKD
jgi:hydrogenase-4 component E